VLRAAVLSSHRSKSLCAGLACCHQGWAVALSWWQRCWRRHSQMWCYESEPYLETFSV